MAIELRRAGERFRTSTDWLEARHSFSFGPYYDPANVGFGFLAVHNDEVVAPHAGYGPHPHQDLEIVTWVLSGALVHEDSAGHRGLVHPGLAQRMSAGSGIRHSERNDAGEPVHYVQMWVRPDTFDLDPSYAQADVTRSLAGGELVPVASGLPEHASSAAVRIHQKDAGLSVARLRPGTSVTLPAAPFVHVFVATGTLLLHGEDVPGEHLDTADAARLTRTDGARLTAGPAGSEVLVWEMR